MGFQTCWIPPPGKPIIYQYRHTQHNHDVYAHGREQKLIAQCMDVRPADHGGERRGPSRGMDAPQILHDEYRRRHRDCRGEHQIRNQHPTGNADGARNQVPGQQRPGLRERTGGYDKQQHGGRPHGGHHQCHATRRNEMPGYPNDNEYGQESAECTDELFHVACSVGADAEESGKFCEMSV